MSKTRVLSKVPRGLSTKQQLAKKPQTKSATHGRPSYDLCHVKARCGSCRFVNTNYSESLKIKHNAGIECLTSAGVMAECRTIAVVSAPRELAYRCVAKIAVRKGVSDEDRFNLGLFEPGTHKIVDIKNCPIHLPVINQSLRYLKSLLEKSSLSAYDETSGSGDLQYIVIRAAHKTNELFISFVCQDNLKKTELKNIVKKLRENHSVHGAFLSIKERQGNQIFGERHEKLLGQDNLRESLCELKFSLGPSSFFQVNPWQAENLYRRIEQLVGTASANSVAWDLYSGVGPIAMLMARAGHRVLAIEENPVATENALSNLRLNGLEEQVEVICGRVEEMETKIPSWAKTPDVLVVNPSRAGIASAWRTQIKRLLQQKPEIQVFYISCDVETLARDLADIQSVGHKPRQIEAFDMFAQTDKLEWLAVLTS